MKMLPRRLPSCVVPSLATVLAVVLGLGTLTAADPPRDALATVSVQVGDRARLDAPVSAELPADIDPWRPMRVVETTGAEAVPVAAQVERGRPPRLWWVLSGTTAAGATRTYRVLRGEPVFSEEVKLALTPRTLNVDLGGAEVLRYNHAHVLPPKGVKPEFIRSGYIHPLFSPSGMLITEDFPADHHHHKGIWMPWTSTRFEGRSLDFWNLGAKQATVQFAGFEAIESGPVYGRFKARHEFVDLTQGPAGKLVLDEVWDVRVWSAGGPGAGYWIVDLTSAQRCASESPLELPAYRYGGIGYRGAKEWKGDDYILLTSEGKTKKDGHATRAKWCANSGAIDGKWSTVVVMCHPSNDRFPEPMRIWDSGGCFFNFCPVQAEAWTLEPGKTYTFRYRFFIHEGGIDKERAERAWLDFAEPPKATLSRA